MQSCVCVCVYKCVYTRSEEHTSELQSHLNLVCRLLLEKKTHSGVSVCVCVSAYGVGGVGLCARHHALTPLLCFDLYVDSSDSYFMSVFFFFFNEGATPEIYLFSPPRRFPF